MGLDQPSSAPLMLYASVQIRADEVVTLLLKGLPSFALELLTRRPSLRPLGSLADHPEAARGLQRWPRDRAENHDESKAVVRYAPTR